MRRPSRPWAAAEKVIARGSYWIPSVLAAVSLNCSKDRGAVQGLSCDDGVVQPLSEIPMAAWPESLVQGLAAIGNHWQGPVPVLLQCPDIADQQLTVTVRAPGEADLRFFSPPEKVPYGAAYICLDVAAGDGFITIEGISNGGVSIDGGPVVIQDLPFAVAIKGPDTTTLVDGAGRLAVSGIWDEIIVNYGIDKNDQMYGSLYFSRQTSTGRMGTGETMQCRMLIAAPLPAP